MVAMARKTVGRKRENFDRDRIEIRAEADWVNLVSEEAARLGLSISAYLRLAANEKLAREGRLPEKPKRKESK